MTREELKLIVVEKLARLAPETDLGALDPDTELRETLELDSLDFLNFVVALHDELGVNIPEADYHKLATLTSCIDYLNLARRPG